MGEMNAENAIVEVEGLRVMPNQYTIYSGLNSLVFDTLTPSANAVISVISFHDTKRQYLNTQYETTTKQVTPILNVENTFSLPLLDTQTSQVATLSGQNYFVAASTTNMVVGQPVVFQVDIPGSSPVYTGFGGVETDGTVYTLLNFNPANGYFQVEDQYGATYPNTTGTGLMHVVVGGQPTVRVETDDPHNLVTNDVVRIDGLLGSVQLNNNLFYVHVITDNIFDIYMSEYSPYVDGINDPVTICNSYIGGGYVWLDQSWMLQTTTATSSSSVNNNITVDSALNLVLNTPVLFTEDDVLIGEQTSIPEIIAGQVYYIATIDIDNNRFTIRETRDGDILTLSATSGQNIRVSQWEQTNVDRLWVTVNGMRVPSSSLKLNAGNQLSILTPIVSGDEIIITSMMPSATPDEDVYINTVDKNNQGAVYRANASTRTWITKSISEFDTIIPVNNVNNLITTRTQDNTVSANILGYYYVTVNSSKVGIIDVKIYNNTKSLTIESDYVSVIVESAGAVLKITEGLWIETGDELTIDLVYGNEIYINGEYMQLLTVDTTNNEILVRRGILGTSIQTFIPNYSTVYGLLESNKMVNKDYNETWNKIPGIYNVELGDPLQIANGGAEFLRMDT